MIRWGGNASSDMLSAEPKRCTASKLDNLFWNVIDTPKLLAKLIKVFGRIIQYEHACRVTVIVHLI
jgi:hypothetical protein